MPRIDPARALADDNAAATDDPLGRYDAVLLSDSGGLTQFGAFTETLQPGAASSKAHWHETEDEFVLMLAGEAMLVEDGVAVPFRPGEAACFPAGHAVGHRIENRSDAPCTYLVVGTRADRDVVHYPETGERLVRDGDERSLFDAAGTLLKQWHRSRLPAG